MNWQPRYKPATIGDYSHREYELSPEAERADLYLLRQQYLEEQGAEIDAFRRRMRDLAERFVQETERAERHYRTERRKLTGNDAP